MVTYLFQNLPGEGCIDAFSILKGMSCDSAFLLSAIKCISTVNCEDKNPQRLQ